MVYYYVLNRKLKKKSYILILCNYYRFVTFIKRRIQENNIRTRVEQNRSRVLCAVPLAIIRYSVSHLYCRFLVRFSRSACPEEYCSITSFTSYGFKASLNLLRATKYLSYTEIKKNPHANSFVGYHFSIIVFMQYNT